MEIVLLPKAKEHIQYFSSTGNKKVLKKITQLLVDIQSNPYFGIGKPEPLKHKLSGLYSRRIDLEHRLIYEIDEEKIFVYSCRGHY
ncbi:MAG TPA: Txe/YoeB family addiction module toxin [Saprospiraceae bacterium]|jgi:toxin YoeB|nr:Txe/YoeB family addiction module toxin [Saprospiraceae bacterium]MBK8885194.1 Txe/YoeB family addiction module toxin [Saprospiraceae bacterium]MBK9580400.1 Txe/YoeB family addiction module toxin [Saprospiraceae bacterium]HMT54943.1 Txe/YoeB family addiction module toxin [Saprospiraceae bacterium]HMT72053.1 Txe/YoeB family addiction module toxin [Saprospiraceae bacterium]